MILESLFQKLGLDLDAQSFAKGQLAVEGIKLALRGLTGVARDVGRAMVGIVTETIKTADHIDELAQSTGITTAALQEFAYAGSFSSLTMDEIGKSLGFLSRNMKAAGEGSKETAAVFRRIGVSVKNSDGTLRDAGDVMEDIADHFASLPDGAEKTATAMQLFGKSGRQLIPMLNAGRDGLAKLRAEAREMGLVLDDAFIKRAAAVDDSLNRLELSWQGIKKTIAVELLPHVEKLVGALMAWMRENRAAIKSALKTTLMVLAKTARFLWAALRLVVGAVRVLWVGLKQLWAGFKAGNPIVLAFIATLIALKAASIAAALATFKAWALAAAPFVLLFAAVAAVVLVIEDLVTAAEGGESVIAALWERFKAFIADWTTVKPGDSPFLVAIKSVIETIGDLPKAWREAIDDMWRAIRQSDLYQFFMFLKGGGNKGTAADPDNLARTRRETAALRERSDRLELANRLRAVGQRVAPGLTGALTTPGASVPLSTPVGPATVSRVPVRSGGGGAAGAVQQVNNLTVVQRPGEDGVGLSQRIRKEISDFWDTATREAAVGVSQ